MIEPEFCCEFGCSVNVLLSEKTSCSRYICVHKLQDYKIYHFRFIFCLELCEQRVLGKIYLEKRQCLIFLGMVMKIIVPIFPNIACTLKFIYKTSHSRLFFFSLKILKHMPYMLSSFPHMYATLMTFLHLIVAGYPTLGERLEELTKQNKYLINTNAGPFYLYQRNYIQPMLC